MTSVYSWYLRQRLSVKLVLPSVIVVLLLTLAGAIILIKVRAQQQIQSSFAAEMVASRELSGVLKSYSEIQAQLYKAVTFSFAGLDAEKAGREINAKIGRKQEIEDIVASASRLPAFSADSVDFSTIINQSGSYFKWVGQVAENLDDPVLAAANMVSTEARFDTLALALNHVLLTQEERMNRATVELNERLSSLMRWQFVMTLLVACIAIGVSLLNLRMFTSFVSRLREDVSLIARGDLTHALDARGGDELGELSASIEEMRKNFLQLLTGLKTTSGRLSESSALLTGLSGHLKSDAATVDNRTGVIAAAGREVGEQSRRMAAEAQTISQGANTTSAALSEMKNTIREISQNCVREAQMAQTTAGRVKEALTGMAALDTATREIDGILKIIDDIAGKTRLLALNATIEAASAGEAGKGFAVVAGEVKELAVKSNSAAEQIQQKINAIRRHAGESIGAVTQISGAVQEFTGITSTIASAVEEQSASVGEIAGSMDRVVASIAALAKGIDDVAERSDKVQNAIRDVEGAAAGTSQKAGQTSESAGALNTMAAELSGNIARFKL